jgi:hypothetical protein
MSEILERKEYNEEESKKWSQQHYLEAMKYCNKHNLKVINFDQPNSRVLPPVLAIWRINLATQPKSSIWLIGGGKVMMDHVDVSMAKNARDALRHFSMSWQLKASQMETTIAANSSGNLNIEQQQKVISVLINEAEALYTLYADEQTWKAQT